LIYLDTNILIAYINPKDKLHNRAISLISRYQESEIVISQLVVLELYSVYSRIMNLSDIELEALVNYTIKKCKVKIATINWDELYSQSPSYANRLKLKTLDLLHVMAAYLVGAKILISFDKDINNKRSTIRDLLGLEVLGL